MCKVLSPMSRIVFVFFCVHWLRMVYGHTTKREEGMHQDMHQEGERRVHRREVYERDNLFITTRGA